MTNAEKSLLAAMSVWFRDLSLRYGSLTLALGILGLGVLVVLLMQPSPLTFAEGWSATREIDTVDLGHPHRAVIDRQDRIHLVWQKKVGRKRVAFYTSLDRHGQLLDDPIRLSDPDLNAENVAVVLANDDAPLCFWIEKGQEGKPQRLMMARPGKGVSAQVVSASPKIMRDLAVAQDQEGRIFLVWSDNRQGLYDIYMAALNGEGNFSFTERQVTDSKKTFVFQPTLAAGKGIVHLAYFADKVVDQELVHQAYDEAGEPLTEPQVLEQVSQAAVNLGGGAQNSYPLLAITEANGQLRLYESLGPMVRQRKIGRDGATVLPPEPLLNSSQYYSQVSLARTKEGEWLIWADLRQGSGDRFQVYTAPLDKAGQVEEIKRLTFVTSSALWPVMVMDSTGGQHVIWQQSTGPYVYRMMYINNLDPARISAWQRLGFSGIGGGWSFLLALAESAILSIITAFINIWRPAIAWAVTALGLQITRRIDAARPYATVVAWVVLLTALFMIVRPEIKTLGQEPIAIAGTIHWIMGAVASAVVLYAGRRWQTKFHGILIWAGIASLWLVVYYFLNITLILRQGFAV